MWCFVSCRRSFSAMFVTIWMCTHEWSLMPIRATALTLATCHHAFSCASSFTRSTRVRSLRLPRTGTLIRIRSTASVGVRRISRSASSATGWSMRSAVSLSIAMRRSIDPGLRAKAVRDGRGCQDSYVNAVNAPALRPLGVGETLDVGIKIYWRNAWTLFRIVIYALLPTRILVNLIQISSLPPGTTETQGFGVTPNFQTSNDTISTADAVTFGVGFAIALLLDVLAGKLAQAGCFRAIADAYLGEEAGWRPSLAYALRRLPAVVAVSILVTLFVALGTIACFVPGVYLYGALYVAVPVVLVEGVGPVRALGRSRELVRGRWWGTMGVATVGTILVSVVSALLTAVEPPQPGFEPPPYWPPPPGWQPVPRAPESLPPPAADEPPYWPPPPGWKPPPPEPTEPETPPYWEPPPGWNPRRE